MLPQLPKDEDRPVCHGCGQAKFLPYSIRTGEPATAKAPIKRVDMSVQFEELRFRSYPSFTRIVIEAGAGLLLASTLASCAVSRPTPLRTAAISTLVVARNGR